MVKEKISSLTDDELVHRYRNSHETSYIGELYQRYTHLVYGVCLKYLKNDAEAEDASMQIFEKLIADLKKHHVTSFKPWLHTVVKNHCMMEFRKTSVEHKRHAGLKYELGNVVENNNDNHLNVEQEAEDKDFILEHLKEAMTELKEEQQTCLELFYMKNCSYVEISKITGYSMMEVKSHLQNGKRNLKNHITSKNAQLKKGKSIL